MSKTQWDTILLSSCCKGEIKLVQEALAKGANVNTVTDTGDTPLTLCLRNSVIGGETTLEVLEVLLSAGANIDHISSDGNTALGLSITSTINRGLTDKIIDAGADPTIGKALERAVLYGFRDYVDIFIGAGANPNQGGLLVSAAYAGHADILHVLLKAGGDPNESRSNSGQTALMYAVMYGNSDCVAELLSANVDIHRIYPLNRTILHIAVQSKYYFSLLADEVVDALLKDVNLETEDSCGNTVLIEAVKNGNIRAVNKLVTAGANIEAVDRQGRTAISLSEDIEVLKVLIMAGADTTKISAKYSDKCAKYIQKYRQKEARTKARIAIRRHKGFGI